MESRKSKRVSARLGITVSRKVGNAVVRNYIKRNIREWFRGARAIVEDCDLVVIARRDAAELRGGEFVAALGELLVGNDLARRSTR